MTNIRLSMIKEVAHGIKGFFDTFVGTQLLYNNERVSLAIPHFLYLTN